MSTVGQSNIQITADDQQARRTIGGFFRGMEAQGRRFTNRMQRFDPLIGVTNSVKNTRQTLAGLQDDFEGLGEGKTFQRITKSLNRVQNSLKTTGQVSQKSLKEMQKEIERVRSTLNELGDDQPFEEMREALAQTEHQFESFQSTTRRFRFNQLENLPDHLKPFQRELNESRRQMRQMSREGTKSLDDLADAAVKSSVGLERITSVTKSGKSAIKIIQDLGDSTKETQLAILGLNRNGTVKISTEETTQRLDQFKRELEESKRKLEALRDAGDFGSYEAGMRVVEKKLADVNKAMYAASRGGQAYQRMINELGVNTSDVANQAAIAMEAYKDKFIRSVDLMNARSNQSKKMMNILPEVSHFQRIDRFFLGIGNRLENMGKQGTSANIAISMLGKNASMKDLNDHIMLINQGLMRMNQVALGLGVVLAGFTAVMFNAAKGPEVADIFEQRGQLLLDYQKAVEDRTQEIVDTWGLFEKAEVEKTKPETLMKNLQGQVDVMKNWSSNIDSLAKRGIDEGLLASLRKMGPEAAGQIQALTKMSDSELNKYVALWKEKHALARKEALTELEGLQKETSQKIKELENSLTPLGISLEKAKSTWLQALQPFIDIWGKIAAKVVDGATAIGEFVNKLNELNPSISASAGMFLYLFNAISLLLAPMAIGIGRAKGMQVAFGAAFIFIKPFVLGFLRIAGAATVLSSAVVLVGGTFIKLWKNSENLRSAVMSLWDTLKEAGSTIAAPFVKAFQMISKEVTALLNKMVGSDAQNMASFWQSIGDKIAVGINKISDVIQPVAEKIASVVEAFVEWEGFLPVIAGLTAAFVTYKATVVGVAAAIKAWNLIQKASVAIMGISRAAMIAYTLAGGGLQGILAVATVAQNALNLSMMANPIGLIIAAIVGLGAAFVVAYKKSDTFRNFIDKLFSAIKVGASAVLNFLKTNWPLLLAIITGPIGLAVYAVVEHWGKIKSATISAFNSVISFFKQWGPLMLAVLAGPIGLAVYAVVKNWSQVKSSTVNIFNSVVSFFKQWGPWMLAVLSGPVGLAVYAIVKNWTSIKSKTIEIFNSVYNFLKTIFINIYKAVVQYTSNLLRDALNNWNSFKNATVSVYTAVKNFLVSLWNSTVSFLTKIATNIMNRFKSAWTQTLNNTRAIFNACKSFLTSIWSSISTFLSNSANSIKNNVVNSWNSLKTRTVQLFSDIKSNVSKIFDDIVSGAKKLPGRIGDGIKSMASGVKKGVSSFANTLVKAMGKGLNGAIGGINWVLEKVDAPTIKEWPIPQYAKGTRNGKHPGGPAWLGDGGEHELYRTPNGNLGLSPNTDTLYNLPKGTEVLSGKQTKQAFANTNIPMYKNSTGLKGAVSKGTKWLDEKAGQVADKGQELYEHAKDKTVETAGKAKDLALDVWDYMSDPEGLMKKVFGKFIPDLPKLGASAGDMLKGGIKKVKDSSIGFIKDKLDGFMSFSGGGGDGTTVGPGSGFGGMHPYVESWYRKVKDKFGPTRFMGAYNNRNVRGGSSKSMHAFGRAFDIGGSSGTMAKIAEWARTHMNNLQYAIYNRRIAGPGMGKPWRHYSGVNPHTDHVHLDFFPGGGSGSGGSAPTGNLAQWIAVGMSRAGVSGDAWRNGLNWIIQKESSGNPKALGAPTSDGTAKGLMQLKHFNYKGDPFNPSNNIYWGIKYIKDRYKSIGGALNWWRSHNWYAKGGVIDRDQIARVGEGNKEEVIIPLEQFKDRAIKLLMYAAKKLGFDMSGMFNAQPQGLSASNFSGMQNVMSNVSNKVVSSVPGSSGQAIQVNIQPATAKVYLDRDQIGEFAFNYMEDRQNTEINSIIRRKG
ncbi:hypothetical protein FA002_02135 [Priestia megaterium]|uniref:aggregation-promoting factor C-terminal-like domain-containing protein n=1 Tax=Priestia megaterium TaxID=1404 RepID=UPI0010AB643A|nr:transglycosylase SLT domain-containing protein [Priestia megaterium]TJZ40391.1 hypothetical protein FA002_02135 [Priestia megaterium]